MGMFDSVLFGCPVCNNSIEVQSKAGECGLAEYSSVAVPAVIANDIDGEIVFCKSCKSMSAVVRDHQSPTVRMKLAL